MLHICAQKNGHFSTIIICLRFRSIRLVARHIECDIRMHANRLLATTCLYEDGLGIVCEFNLSLSRS